MTRAARVVLGVALVAASGPAGFLVFRMFQAAHGPAAPAATPPGSVTSFTRHPVPERLPDLVLPDARGVSHSLSEWQGHPLVVNFWATWCEPCRREIPLLKSLGARHADMDLTIVGIAVDFRNAVLPFAQQMGIDYPILIGEDAGLKAVDAFGMDAVFPFSVFADPSGRILALKVGELHADDADLILSRMAALDAGRLSLAEARRQVTNGLADLAVERARRSQSTVTGSGGKS